MLSLLLKAAIKLSREMCKKVSVFLMFLLDNGLLLVEEGELMRNLLLEVQYGGIKFLRVFFEATGKTNILVRIRKGVSGGRGDFLAGETTTLDAWRSRRVGRLVLSGLGSGEGGGGV